MKPIRTLQVVSRMHRGGVETWLMQVLRNLDPTRARMDFVVHSTEPGDYDDELLGLGARVIPCLSPARPIAYARRFLEILREGEPYDVVHSHVHHFGGFVLALARVGGVPIRIAHSHSDTSGIDESASFARRTYLATMRSAFRLCATKGLAASDLAGGALFGAGWRRDPRYRILRCSLDFSPFEAAADPRTHEEFGIPGGALVIGHVGRFVEAKNHAFLLRIAAELRRRDSRAWFVLVGDGPLRARTEREASALGLSDCITFTGVRADVHRLLRMFDVFLLPSLREGLPLVGLEAQAAGVPIVLSDTISRELEVVPGQLRWCSLDASAETWANEVSAAAAKPVRRGDALELMFQSDFSLRRSLKDLELEYGVQ